MLIDRKSQSVEEEGMQWIKGHRFYRILRTEQPQTLVQRVRLVERLNEGMRCKLVLISAPAGFGKTTLLSDWIPQSKMRIKRL